MPPPWEYYEPPPFDPDEEAAAAVREAEQAARYDDTERHYAEQQRRASLRRYGKESARRQKLFDRAHAVLAATIKLRTGGNLVWVAGETRSGQRHGLAIGLDADHDMEWTPRGGYRIVETQPLPF